MINANELRIGNWVEYLGKHCQVDMNILYAVGKIVPPSVMYNPIPLTPEILSKCGFKKFSHEPGYAIGSEEKSERCDEYSLGKLCVMDWGDGLILSNSSSFDHRIELKSLHQLQNITFSLTGKELEYSL